MRGLNRVEGRVEGVKSATAAALASRTFQPATLLGAARVQEVKVGCPGAVGTAAAARADRVEAGRVGGFRDRTSLIGPEGAEEGAFKRDRFTTLADEGVGEEADEAATAGRGIIGGGRLGVVEKRDMME